MHVPSKQTLSPPAEGRLVQETNIEDADRKDAPAKRRGIVVNIKRSSRDFALVSMDHENYETTVKRDLATAFREGKNIAVTRCYFQSG